MLGRAALILVAAVCTYWNSLDLPFLWDDQTAIVTNTTIRELWPPWPALSPPLETPVSARPLVNASFAINYSMSGLGVRGYHAGNLGLHMVAALLLFGIIRRTLESERIHDRLGVHAADIAVVAALWWVMHPLVSEVIDYTTQRTTAMMGLFLLMTLYCSIRALSSPNGMRWQVLAIVACACGMASKEEMATAPLVVALYDRVFVFRTMREALATRKALYAGFAATWIGLGTLIALWPRSTVGVAAGDAWTYALNQAQVIPHYMRLALWPDQLVLDYGLPAQLQLADVAGGVILLTALLALTVVSLTRWPKLGFLGAVFFLTLAPTSSVVPILSEVGAERRMYLPLAATAALLSVAGAHALAHVRRSYSSRHARLVTAGAVTLTVIVLSALATRSVYRNADYANDVALWRSSVEHWPNGRARVAYAVALTNAGQSDAALSQLHEAARDYGPARYALGVELAAKGDNAEARQALTAFIADDPAALNRIPARLLLGRLLFADSELDEAARQFRSVVDVAPTNVDAQLSLGDLLTTQRRYAEAAAQYRAVLRLQPDAADWLIRLGKALDLGGKPDEAAEAFRKVLARGGAASRLAHLHLADMWLRYDKPTDAIPHAREAVRAGSRDSAAHNLLGAALAQSGQIAEAVEHFRAAVTLNPGNNVARASLSRAEGLLKGR